jgi:hypothetical protein
MRRLFLRVGFRPAFANSDVSSRLGRRSSSYGIAVSSFDSEAGAKHGAALGFQIFAVF